MKHKAKHEIQNAITNRNGNRSKRCRAAALLLAMTVVGMLLGGCVQEGNAPQGGDLTTAGDLTSEIGTPAESTAELPEEITKAVTEETTEAVTEETTEAVTEETTEADGDVIHGDLPDFTVYDANGDAVKLSDFRGTPTVINFWASWCPPCRAELPDFEEAYRTLGDEVQFVMVNLTDGTAETVASVQDFLAENGYTFPVFFDTTGEAAERFGVVSIPMTFFLDAEGHPIAQATGMIDAETLLYGISLIC